MTKQQQEQIQNQKTSALSEAAAVASLQECVGGTFITMILWTDVKNEVLVT